MWTMAVPLEAAQAPKVPRWHKFPWTGPGVLATGLNAAGTCAATLAARLWPHHVGDEAGGRKVRLVSAASWYARR
jgi:hypothetical protein